MTDKDEGLEIKIYLRTPIGERYLRVLKLYIPGGTGFGGASGPVPSPAWTVLHRGSGIQGKLERSEIARADDVEVEVTLE